MKRAMLLLSLVALFVAVTADVVYLTGIIRDQAPNTMKYYSEGSSCGTANNTNGFWGTDFELDMDWYKDFERGLVGNECNTTNNFKNCGKLGADGTPVYAYPGLSPWHNIQSPASFYTWFHNSVQTKNINYSIPLSADPNANTYSFRDDDFFPIDGKGWKDFAHMKISKNTYVDHNFAFCLEAHTRFGYKYKEMKFSFTGDDDVWVYIDGYLVIDLGSLHNSESKSVTLGDLTFLTVGNNYRLDFFYCERHTEASHMQITTSLELFCANTDWCGICEGTGQSCCDAAALAKCNDNDACTIDACGTTAPPGGCIHTPLTNCTAPDACHLATCDKVKGCQITALNCDDSDPCTVDTCTSSGCKHTPMVCNDNDLCTTDSCSAGKCVFTPKVCNDNDACTDDKCGADGACVFTTKTCDDSNKCTKDTCDKVNGCKNAPACDDGNACTTDSCISASQGCRNVPVDCSTTDKCVTSACSATTGKCVTTNITCVDKDKCNIAKCLSDKGCQYSAPDCDDKDPCTVDSCSPTQGCQHTPLVCNDNDRCTSDSCSASAGGCIFTPLVKDDNNKCTDDFCTQERGVYHTNITCNDGDDCTDDSCSATKGCQFTPKNCDTGASCMVFSCLKVGGCQATPVPNCVACSSGSCVTTDKCNPAVCDFVNGGCKNVPVNCNDGNNCTTDSCSATDGKCFHEDVSCTPRNKCETASCDAANGGVCKYTPITCDDFDPCTTDQCQSDGSCKHTPIATFCTPCGASACGYEDACNPTVCNATTLKCQAAPVQCDDGNACTNEKCVVVNKVAKCQFTDVICPSTGDVCKPNVCDTKSGCGIVPVVCKDTDPCTVDTCADVGGVATCQFPEKACNVSDPCNPYICNAAGECVLTPVVCNDGDICTQDLCVVSNGKGTCYFPDVDCGSDTCGEKVCNPTSGKCESAILSTVCNDGNPCTDDAAVCNGTAVNCNFTINSICDDKNACTNEVCDSSNKTAPCVRSDVTCYPSSVCEMVDRCDTTSGCLFKPVVCPGQDDVCKVASCDVRAGCIVEPKVCTVSDSGCFKATCDSSKNATEDPCVVEKLDNWGSRKSNNGILCALRYDDTVKKAVIGAGAAAGIAIGAAAAFGAFAYGGKKGYDYWKGLQEQRFNGVQNNPLYEANSGSTDNPLYRHSVTA